MVTVAKTLSGTFLTVSEAADHMGCTEGWVRMLIRNGKLQAQRHGLRAWLIPLEAATKARAGLTTRSNGKKAEAIRPAADRKPVGKPARKRAKR